MGALDDLARRADRRRRIGAGTEEHEQPGGALPGEDEAKQLEGVGAGPVHVVEHEQHRPGGGELVDGLVELSGELRHRDL